MAGVRAPETRLTGALVASSAGRPSPGDQQRDRAPSPRRDEPVQTGGRRTRPARREAIENQNDLPSRIQSRIVVVTRRRDAEPRGHELAPHRAATRPAVRHPVPPGLQAGRADTEPRERVAGTQADGRADDEALKETSALPAGAESGRRKSVDDVARRTLRPDGAGCAALHLGGGEGKHVGGKRGWGGRSDTNCDRRARRRNQQNTDEEDEPSSHVSILPSEPRVTSGTPGSGGHTTDISAKANGRTSTASPAGDDHRSTGGCRV